PDPQKAMRTILEELDQAVRLDLPAVTPPSWDPSFNPKTALSDYLSELCARVQRPLVVLIDEADCLVGPSMGSLLTQLRRGYLHRDAAPFPRSVALIGMRQVRDYVLGKQDHRQVTWLGTSSPFNITAEASTLAPFSPQDVRDLVGQHTTQTGQVFTGAA